MCVLSIKLPMQKSLETYRMHLVCVCMCACASYNAKLYAHLSFPVILKLFGSYCVKTASTIPIENYKYEIFVLIRPESLVSSLLKRILFSFVAILMSVCASVVLLIAAKFTPKPTRLLLVRAKGEIKLATWIFMRNRKNWNCIRCNNIAILDVIAKYTKNNLKS